MKLPALTCPITIIIKKPFALYDSGSSLVTARRGGGLLHQIVGSLVRKMRGQKDVWLMKKGVNWIENQGENLYQNAYKLFNNTLCWKIRPTLGPSISDTKCDRDKLLIFFRKRGQSDRDEA